MTEPEKCVQCSWLGDVLYKACADCRTYYETSVKIKDAYDAHFDRALTHEEIADLHRDPWQLFTTGGRR